VKQTARPLLALLIAAGSAQAQQLGTISFSNSGSPAAQAPFIRGVLYLHSFEYDEAASAFREAQTKDPGFALAYWGEALSLTHPVWNEQDLAAARSALARLAPTAAARRVRAPTHREQMYLDAVEILYGEGSKPRRDTLYAQAMERLTGAHPEDDEARAFYALALLGLNQGVRDVPAYMRAGAIAQEILSRKPDHPGAAHYVIHAFDDPVHAPLGLPAARAYSRIAPAAPHAQHMTTHIFLAVGMWDEVVSQNIIASGPDRSRWRAGHYPSWLAYGLLQQGRYRDAAELLDLVKANLREGSSAGEHGYLQAMRAHHIVNTEEWDGAVARWEPDLTRGSAVTRAMSLFASGYAALKREDRAGAEGFLSRLGELARSAPPAEVRIMERELAAMLLLAGGKRDEAIAILKEAAKAEDGIPAEFGPPAIVKPTHELLGEVLLAAGDVAGAVREFRRALDLAPGRSRALLGLTRATSR